MKTTTRKAVWSLCGLCIVLLVYSCRNEEAEPLTPYVFNELRDLQLPAVRLAAPEAITVTASTLTPSPLANSVNVGIAAIPGSGSVPAVVNQAVSNINNALSAAGVTSGVVVSSFTPQVITTLTAQGTLPGSLQTTVNTLTANATVLPYLPTFTYPRVNGQEITPTIMKVAGPGLVSPIINPVVVKPINQNGGDPCFEAANDLFDMKIAGLDADRLASIASVNNTYALEKSSAESDLPGCVASNTANYSSLITTARQNLTAAIANLNGARLILGESAYQSLTALTYVQYAYQIQIYYKLQAAEINVCTIVSALRIESAQFARDTNRNTLNDGFNSTVKLAQVLVLQLYDACHNQGSGSNG